MVKGVWEMFTYGLFVLYKSDWIEVDGFDNTTWVGEDMDLLDRYAVKKSLSLSLSLSVSLSLSLSFSLSLTHSLSRLPLFIPLTTCLQVLQ